MTGVFYVPLRQQGGGTDTEYESAHKVNCGEENPPAPPAGNRTHDFPITSPALQQLSYSTCWHVGGEFRPLLSCGGRI